MFLTVEAMSCIICMRSTKSFKMFENSNEAAERMNTSHPGKGNMISSVVHLGEAILVIREGRSL